MLITFLRHVPYLTCRAASCATDSACVKAEQKAKADEFAKRLAGVIDGMKARGLAQRAMVEELNSIGVRTSRGGGWSLIQLQRGYGSSVARKWRPRAAFW